MRYGKFWFFGLILMGCDGEVGEEEEECKPSAEICDREDNDCDGVFDEGCAGDCVLGDTRPCGRPVGECALNLGTQRCDAATGLWVTTCPGSRQENDVLEKCTGAAEKPADEDCDGSTDEGCPCEAGATESCGPATDAGRCEFGTQVCIGNAWSDCFEVVLPTEETCDGEDNDCDGVTDNGFDLATDELNCGSCGMVCSLPNSTPACASGLCRIESCDVGFANIDLDAVNGCEYACPVTPSTEETCNSMDDDCDGAVDDVDPSTLTTDLANCGSCGKACSFANAEAGCAGGDCYLVSCDPNFWNLDGDEETGCEYGPCLATAGGVEQCDGIDNDCNGTVDDVAVPALALDVANCGACGNVCSFANANATCLDGTCLLASCRVGYYNFDGDAISNGCEYLCPRTNPSPEVCNGEDDDCDGMTDENFSLTMDVANCGACGQVCNPPNAVPTCAGGLCFIDGCEPGFIDLNDSALDGCEYECTPSGPEFCDAAEADEDCDGAVNEDCSCIDGLTRPCGTDEGACEPGSQMCAGGLWSDCLGGTGPVAETCNGSDDDCDSTVDEDFDFSADVANCGSCGTVCSFMNAVAFCDAGVCTMGSCATNFWDADSDPGDGCEYGPCLPTAGGVEQCDGIDNDCSGAADEGCSCTNGEIRSCGPTTDVGECEFGTQTCSGGTWGTCFGAVFPTTEVCENGADEDCDGTDASCPPPPPPTDSDSDGDPDTTDCAPTDPTIYTGAPEICGNGVDEDCNGIEPACPPPPPPPPTPADSDSDGDPDTSDCAPTDPTIFTGAMETCNGVDDNCDGAVDEGFGLGAPCDGADADFCLEGTTTCSGCAEAAGDNLEICNSVDDDCDGVVDEGVSNACGGCATLPAVGAPCDGADLDSCAEGTYTSTCAGPNTLGCSDASGEIVEVCANSLDDNCNGAVDELCSAPVLTVSCTDTGTDLTIVVNGALSTATIGTPAPPGETIMTVELGADLNGCWDEAVSCFPTAYLGDGVDHTFMGVPYTNFTPRWRTDAGTVRYLDLRQGTSSGACTIVPNGSGGLVVDGVL